MPRAEGNRDASAPLARPGADTTGAAAPRAETRSAAAPDVAQTLAAPGAAPGETGIEAAPEVTGGMAQPVAPTAPAPSVTAPEVEAEPDLAALAPDLELDAPEPTDPAAATSDEEITLPPAGFPQGDLDAIGTAPQGTGNVTAPAALPSPSADPVAPSRLPQIGTDAPASEAAEGEAGPDVALAAPETPDLRLPGQVIDGPLTDRGTPSAADGAEAAPLPPVQAFAADYDATDPRPRMAIVLIDEGDERVSLSALRSFPYPISFAIDASRPDAALAMQAYREAGFEVLLRADLPEGATPGDVENAVQTWVAQVPEAVAVMEEAPGQLQRGREPSEQLAEALAESGHGLLLYPEGLNTARNLALREGVPAATLFRDFDAQDEDARVIRRFLDYAALKAGQEGGAIMVGRLRPDTVSALLVWGLADRASQVHLVPVSAVLTEAGAE